MGKSTINKLFSIAILTSPEGNIANVLCVGVLEHGHVTWGI